MTFEEYIGNPAGKSAVFTATAREAMRNSYKQKYDAIMVREHSHIDYTLYKNKNNRYLAYIKIPSEIIEKFYYDVLIEFYADSNIQSAGNNLMKYNVRFWSNDPSFVYTYAHAFLENDMLITELKSKMSKQAIKKEAKERNPFNQIGYVKSIYFAYLLLLSKGLFNTNTFSNASDKLDFNLIKSNIIDADQKIFQRQEAQNKLNKTKKKEKIKKENIKDNIENNIAVSKINKIKSVSNTNRISSIKSISTIKKVKRK